ncbi:hypothetical protein A2775_01350 [Candidatus Curtissbacteria bacterium RIFCSPHIGHO2_01_FULL_39_57]|uniref:DUF4185 domain-containing protein n=1 Tax=Candidatus Curtissbacteria bacterium RIFCSPHIGHO2_02_FULL_40_16b TaxID=1797714 RepID=A0A1F5GB07_9BACT|nr:MAG: hypothetical protein A2775_01350 [Candidatus Curtissbacteria bacterium RIFCSPHIGHO2_01_FULL_39_57]OGD89062.1 MAG: hypothetical protein A3D04_00835 [Candidatus Curtissbacteria bacterium RIFCSPHIGHO2_02_FULL_40_16b]
MFRKSSGFTIVELLIVIAIIGILAAAVMVAINPGKRTAQARDGVRKANLKTIATALQTYYVDHDLSYPPDPAVDDGTQFSSAAGGVWIPGLAPEQIKTLPTDPRQAGLFHFFANALEVSANQVSKLLAKGFSQKIPGSVEAAIPLVKSQRQVCSILGTNQQAVGIDGQDAGTSFKMWDKVYWTFGDTVVEGVGYPIPNNIASTTDLEASDCILMTSKSSGGQATALLPTVSGELTVWPDGMAHLELGAGHFFYMSVRVCTATEEDCTSQTFVSSFWKVRGIGLARFPFNFSLPSNRIGNCSPITDCLFWQETGGYGFEIAGATTYQAIDFIYVFLNESDNGIDQQAVRLARVPRNKASVENKNAYQYWNGLTSTWVSSLAGSSRLMTFPGFFNGVSIAYNNFLGKWTAIYTTDNFSKVAMRTAASITGPWTTNDEILYDCTGLPPGSFDLYCYFGRQHPEYQKNNGETIYVTYNNYENYQVYLHEIVFNPPPLPSPTPLPSPPPLPSPSASPQVGEDCGSSDRNYCYVVAEDRKSFGLWAQLENLEDPDLWDKPNANCKIDPESVFGQGTPFNYCFVSPP